MQSRSTLLVDAVHRIATDPDGPDDAEPLDARHALAYMRRVLDYVTADRQQ